MAKMNLMTEARARSLAKALKARLPGTGWRIDVWENLGWHYAVYNGPLTVHASIQYASCGNGRLTYFTLLNSRRERGGGEIYWTTPVEETYRTPQQALRAQAKAARAFLDRITPAVQHVETMVALLDGKKVAKLKTKPKWEPC